MADNDVEYGYTQKQTAEAIVDEMVARSVGVNVPWIPIALSPASANHESVSSANKAFFVPLNMYWQLSSLHVTMTTSAAVGNRFLHLRIEDSVGAIYAVIVAGVGQAASLTRLYTFTADSPDLTAFRDGTRLRNPLPNLTLPPGFRVRAIENNNIDSTGDSVIIRALVLQREAVA